MKAFDIEELYWSDLDDLANDSARTKEVLDYLKDYENRSIEDLAKTLMLYSNPSGALTDEFADLITGIYKYDKVKFFKALSLEEDEAMNLTYIFRNLKIFEDEDQEIEEINNSNQLSGEEKTVASMFFKMYKAICSS